MDGKRVGDNQGAVYTPPEELDASNNSAVKLVDQPDRNVFLDPVPGAKENKGIRDRSISGDSGLGDDILLFSDAEFENARNALDRIKDHLTPGDYAYGVDAIKKFQVIAENFDDIQEKMLDGELSLKEKEGAFRKASGGMLCHLSLRLAITPEQLVQQTGWMISRFFKLLEDPTIDNREIFNSFMQSGFPCMEARLNRAMAYEIMLQGRVQKDMAGGIDVAAEYGHDLEIDTILSNEVLAFQKINKMDPLKDIVSGSDFKKYLINKGDCIGYQAVNGKITEGAIDQFIDEQVNENMTMDP